MGDSELEQVLVAWIVLLRQTGYVDMAARLGEQLDLLHHAPDEPERSRVRERLRGAIHGMGGLLDLRMSGAAADRQEELADRLMALTT